MQVLLSVLTTLGAKSSVPDVIFATVGAVASALDEDFAKYMEPFSPFLYNALEHQEEAGLCSMAIGLVSDIARALNDKVQPYCDTFMNLLLNILRVCSTIQFNITDSCLLTFRNKTSTNQLKPAILETFGDIAQAIGTPHFDNYLPVVGQVLQQASSVTTSSDLPYDMVDYIVSLREGIMDAWGGILLSYKGSAQSKPALPYSRLYFANDQTVTLIQPFVESIFQLLHIISQEGNRSEGLMRSAMGVIGFVYCPRLISTMGANFLTVISRMLSLMVSLLPTSVKTGSLPWFGRLAPPANTVSALSRPLAGPASRSSVKST